MRYIVNAAIAAAICATSASMAVAAEPAHNPGDPNQSGNMYWVSTNSELDFGYWKECAPGKAVAH